MTVYRGEYYDTEADPVTNENVQVAHRIDIIDNPYGIELQTRPNPDTPGLTDYIFTFMNPPKPVASTQVDYSTDGVSFTNLSGLSATSPVIVPISTNDFIFRFRFIYQDGSFLSPAFLFDEVVIPLEMADNPCRDIVIDNDEDKFTPIRARQLEINLHTSNSINIDTFSEGADNRYRVNKYVNSVRVFVGFLSLGDLQQDELPDPNVLSLIAVDGLGFLNDIPLTDFKNRNPEQENTILDYILWCLAKTGVFLNLAASYNIREEGAVPLLDDTIGTGHFFMHEYLDAKTFEDEVGTCINCYEVLARILGESAVLFQAFGEYRIMRIDELDFGLNQYYSRWTFFGDYIDSTFEDNSENLYEGEAYSWANDSAVRAIDRMVKESRLTYKYETPKENPCNLDFERGAILTDTPTEKTYDVECWAKLWSNTSTDDPQQTGIYIKKLFTNDYETSRFVVLEADAAHFTFIKSSKIPVKAKSKFNLGVSMRMDADIGGSGFFRDNMVQVRLYGSDGSFWTHHGKNSAEPTAYWEACTSTFRTNQHFFSIEGDAGDDQSESKSLYDGESAEIPVSGYIQILVYRSSQFGDTNDTYIESVTFDYLAYINGSFQKYTSQQWLVKQTVDTRNIREKEVFISDSPERLFKGALQKVSDIVGMYTGSAIFAAGNSVSLPGNYLETFPAGSTVKIIGTSINNIQSKIIETYYSFVTSKTVITFDKTTVAESPASITIGLFLFDLCGLFYDAAREQSGPVTLRPFGLIQAFDVWNQFNRTMKKFEGDVDHSTPYPTVANKIFPTLDRGIIFLLLHYELDTYLCEWKAFMIEVANQNFTKQYEGQSFKYLTNE